MLASCFQAISDRDPPFVWLGRIRLPLRVSVPTEVAKRFSNWMEKMLKIRDGKGVKKADMNPRQLNVWYQNEDEDEDVRGAGCSWVVN